MKAKLGIVHFVNQFFGQIGGEVKANVGPMIAEGPVGPGLAINQALAGEGEVVATVICGDNYFAENIETAIGEIAKLIKQYKPDLVLAGPAFNAGRYGIACGEVCKAAKKQLSIPAVTAMYEENPGVDLYKSDVVIVKTGHTAASMKAAVTQMVNIGKKLLKQEQILPDVDGYFPQGYKSNIFSPEQGAKRAVDMLLAKLRGQEVVSEIKLPKFDKVPPAPPIKDLSKAVIALVTDGGLYPAGNPDRIEASGATKFGQYSIDQVDSLSSERCEVNHNGYDNAFVEADPNRLVAVDVARELEKEGHIGKLFPYYFATTGVVTTLANSKRIGESIAAILKENQVDGVILTST